MRKTLYESLRIAFPELNDTAIPEEQDEFCLLYTSDAADE
mgnify:CR=1 FL=1